MRKCEAVSEILRVAKTILGASLLDGLDRRQAARLVNSLIGNITKGFFHDQGWAGPKRVWDKLNKSGIDWTMTKTEYHQNDQGVPDSKVWKFEVNYLDKKSRPKKLYGVLTASGAGSVEDPLDRYDVTVYVS